MATHPTGRRAAPVPVPVPAAPPRVTQASVTGSGADWAARPPLQSPPRTDASAFPQSSRRPSAGPQSLPPQNSSLLAQQAKTPNEKRAEKFARGPYEASQGKLGARLNAAVQVLAQPLEQAGAQQALEPVMCRHFAQRFTEAHKKGPLMKDLSTEWAVANQFSGRWAETDASFRRAAAHTAARSKHVITGDQQTGQYLSALARALNSASTQSGGPTEANCLLLTATHVQRKTDEDSSAYFAAKLYDPSETATYKRVVVKHPEDLEQLTLKDLLVLPEPVERYGAPGQAFAMAAVCLEPTLQLPTERSAVAATAENMHMALAYGASADLQAMAQAAMNKPQAELFSLLRAVAAKSGHPGAHKAMDEGQSAAVRMFADTVLTCALPLDQKMELLEAKNSLGVLGLFMALQNGREATVATFAQAVLDSAALNGPRQMQLLAAKRHDRLPALAMALYNGHAEAVTAFVQAVTASTVFTPAQQVDLLTVTAQGLLAAARNGHLETLAAYREAVGAAPHGSDAQKHMLSLG